MRTLILGCVAVVIASGCGSGSESPADGGSGGGGGTQVNLKISTTGNGVVRGAGADCRGNCTAQYTAGAQVHLAAVADSGSSFVGWAGACSGTAGCDLKLDADRDVSATFAVAPPPPVGKHRLTVVVQGKGRVTSSPSGLDCDSSQCSADFTDGTTVTLTAAASSGYGFDSWGTDCSGSGGCTITLSKDATVYANFVAQPPPPAQAHLAASTTGPGTVTGGGLNCGESSSTCDVMVATGSQVTLTASPAGGARFFGWGGACSGTSTTCQLTVQSDARVTAEFQSEVMVLAPNDGTNGSPDCVFCSRLLAINSTQLFWNRYPSEQHRDGLSIWAIPKKGGTAVRVADGSPSAMVADDGYLYWTDSMNLYSTPVGGGEVALLAREPVLSINKLALDETGALYYVTGRGLGTNGSVHRMQNRADTVLASGQNAISIAVDATHVYYGDASRGIASVRRVPRNGGAVQSVYSCGESCYVQAIRVDSANVYFRSTSTGHVQALSKSDFSVRTLSGANSGGYQYPVEVEANAFVVYWNWLGGAPYGIFRANADGTGFAAVDTSNDDSSWYGLRVDDTALYYAHGGAIIRRLK